MTVRNPPDTSDKDGYYSSKDYSINLSKSPAPKRSANLRKSPTKKRRVEADESSRYKRPKRSAAAAASDRMQRKIRNVRELAKARFSSDDKNEMIDELAKARFSSSKKKRTRVNKMIEEDAKARFSSKSSSLTVFKQDNGQIRWVLFSSNPYLDREKEFVTQKAHEEDIKVLDKTGDYGPLRWWHMGDPFFEEEGDWTTVKSGPGVDIGTCDFAAMHGRIRVESGTFKSEKIGRAFLRNAEDLEGSLAFSHPRAEPDAGGGFLNIKSFERSLTPRSHATNLFTSLIVSSKGNNMDSAKLKALKDLGVDIDEVLDGAEQIQKKADRSAPYRLKSRGRAPLDEVADDVGEDDDDIATKLDNLTAQMKALEASMQKEPEYEPEEKLEDLMVSEMTVGELQDIISQSISQKSAEPMGVVMKAVLEELDEIKSILTSKSVQSVVEEVARMKAKLERTQARLKATASRVRDLDDQQPTMVRRGGVRPSQSDDTLLDLEDDAELAQKASSGNPFSWIDDFIQKQG